MTKILIDEAVVRQAQMYFNMIATGNNLDWIKHQAGQQSEALRQALANEALDKMAENARELGLSYEQPAPAGYAKKIESLIAERDALKAKLAEQPAPPECKTDAEKTAYAFGWYKALESVREQSAPAQEPVAWRDAALRVGEDLCSVGPFGYYDMTAQQWLDWALSVVTVHSPPAQEPDPDELTIAYMSGLYEGKKRKPLTDEQIEEIAARTLFPIEFARAIEAAHGITKGGAQ